MKQKQSITPEINSSITVLPSQFQYIDDQPNIREMYRHNNIATISHPSKSHHQHLLKVQTKTI